MKDFPNLAGADGVEADRIATSELEAAGIELIQFEYLRSKGEVKTCVIGHLDPSGWGFKRAWRYWIAEGPGLPLVESEVLYHNYGKEVRVNGNCTAPSPRSALGFAIGLYHVDSPEGLKALADAIKGVLRKSEKGS